MHIFDMHRIIMKNSVKFLPMLLVMVALMLGSCHTKKTTTTYKPGTSRPVKIPDEWRTLDISLSASDNKKLYREIKGWLGTPYQYAGNTKRGVDCSGFVHQIYKAVYKKTIERNSAKIFEKNCKLIDVDDLREGDLVFYCTSRNTKKINHVGIYLKDNKFAHASSSSGVKISDITEDYFINHFYAAGRVVR